MSGVSLIRVYFKAGTSADTDVTELSNLALADLKRLPPEPSPACCVKFDVFERTSMPGYCQGPGITQTQLYDLAQFTIRNQIAVVEGATIPPPFGGKYRQVMGMLILISLMSRQLSPMDEGKRSMREPNTSAETSS